MKYPQVFVFFKKSTVIDQGVMHTTVGRKLDIHFGPVASREISAVDLRAKSCNSFLQIDKRLYLEKLPYVVVNTDELNSLFVLKYSAEIEGVVWLKSWKEFKQFRAGLVSLKDYWISICRLEASIRSYNRLEKILGTTSPEFTYKPILLKFLEDHKNLLKSGSVYKALLAQMHATGRVGKYQL